MKTVNNPAFSQDEASTSFLTPRKAMNMVDALGGLNAEISALQRKADAMKVVLKASGYEEVFGNSYRAVITTKTTARLGTAEVRAFLTPAQVDFCTVESTSTSISLYDL